MIREAIGSGEQFGLRVRYVDEGPELRGTGGALRLAFEQGALEETFLLTYGDSYLPIDFGEVWRTFRERNAPALMTVYRNEELFDASNVIFENQKVTLYEKGLQSKPPGMKWIDYGLSALRREEVEMGLPTIAELERRPKETKKIDLAELFHRLSLQGKLHGYEVATRFYEIGSFSGLEDLQNYLKKGGSVAQ